MDRFFSGFRLTPRCHPLAESIGQGLLHAFRWRFIPGTEGAEGERWSLCSRCVWSKFVLFPPSVCLREMALLCWLAVNFARYLLDVRRGQRNSVGWHRFGLDHVHPVFQLVEEVNEYQVVHLIFFFMWPKSHCIVHGLVLKIWIIFFFQGKRRRVGSCWGVGSCLAVTPTLERVWDVDPVSSGRATRLGRRMCWSFLSKEERRWIALSDRSIASRCFCWPCTTRPEFDFGPFFFCWKLMKMFTAVVWVIKREN